LSTEPEQDLNDRLELTEGGTGLPAAEKQAADGKLGVRVRYQVFFDEVLGEYDLAWGYSASGNLVPRAERDLLAAVVTGSGRSGQRDVNLLGGGQVAAGGA
jgi:hypothetical protein